MASSLHNHSEYSVLDGFSHPENIYKERKRLDYMRSLLQNTEMNILGFTLTN